MTQITQSSENAGEVEQFNSGSKLMRHQNPAHLVMECDHGTINLHKHRSASEKGMDKSAQNFSLGHREPELVQVAINPVEVPSLSHVFEFEANKQQAKTYAPHPFQPLLPCLFPSPSPLVHRSRLVEKIDRQRVVSREEGAKWAGDRGYEYFETSASSGTSVNAMFTNLFGTVLAQTSKSTSK